MGRLIELDDRDELFELLSSDSALHIYELGDLDPFFWNDAAFFGWQSGSEILCVALVYTGDRLPCLILLDRNVSPAAHHLLGELSLRIPQQFYAHLSPGLVSGLATRTTTTQGRFLKLAVNDASLLTAIATFDVEALGREHIAELIEFYDRSYPGHWFSERMIDTGQYFGARERGELVAAGGVHVYSPRYGVAALGNIATHPQHRRRGYGRRVTARLCQSLLDSVDIIGLNVKADNAGAIGCYRGLGFATIAEYDEVVVDPIQ